jgi:8-amino-3,8-dideoxy-alpha-D-manno-octulosonate transaminase
MGRGISIEEAPQFGGQNYRASEFIGAIGLVQLNRLDGLIAAMRDHKQRILASLHTIPGLHFRRLFDFEGDAAISVVFFLPTPDKAQEFSKALSAENVYTRNLYCADRRDYHVYSHWHHILNKVSTTSANFPWERTYYQGSVNYSKNMCPRTLELLGCAVEFDVSPHLTSEDVNEIIIAVEKVANAIL